MCAQAITGIMIPAAMVGAFYYNMTEWIGDKTCFYNEVEGVAYPIETGGAGEIDVAGTWKTYSLVGMIMWGVVILARICGLVAGCAMLGGEAGAVAAIPIGIGSCCCTFGAAFGLVGLTIWGSILRFGDSGQAASQELLKDSGMAMMI